MSTPAAKSFLSLSILLLLFIIALLPSGAQGDPVVCLQTTKGPIYIRIFGRFAPRTANNFLDLVSKGFYNGLSFHRVENWVIQGGDPNGNGTGIYVDPQTGGPRYVPLESNRILRHNAPGVVAMAHGPNPNTNSCQFYITKRPAPEIDGNYSIFGGVVQGLNVVYSIAPGDRILSAEIVNNPSAAPRPAPAPESESNGEASSESGF